jgi:methionyl aminopeptidase
MKINKHNNSDYLDIFRENGAKTAEIKFQLVEYAQTKPKLEDIDKLAEDLMKKAGGEPAFKRVPNYHWTTCIALNDAFVHAIPEGKLNDGDIVTIDLGMYYHGTTTDTATTFVIGKPTPDQEFFLNVGKKTLKKTIKHAKVGARIKKLSKTMQEGVEKAGYSVTRNLTGHGLGETMHEEPSIPCFTSQDPNLRIKLQPDMVLAIEIMYMKGDWPLAQDNDGWTLRTQDGSDSAMFEEDVIITYAGPEVITNPDFNI